MVLNRMFIRKIGLIAAVIGVTLGLAASAGCLEGGIQNPIAVAAPSPDLTPGPAPTPEPVPEPQPEPEAAPESVKNICSQCHGLQDVDKNVIVAGRGVIAPLESINQTVGPRASWESTVDRMRDTNGCTMTDEERTEIIAWLDSL